LEGAQLVRAAARRAKAPGARATLLQTARILEDREAPGSVQAKHAFDPELVTLMHELYQPRDLTTYHRELEIYVDREPGRFAAWYELFPRSQVPLERGASIAPRHGTFDDAAKPL